MIEAGQVWRPARMAEVVPAREVVGVGELVQYRVLGRQPDRVHQLNAADFLGWARFFGATCNG